MPIVRKRGALSTDEMRFIEEHCDTMSVLHIAQNLNRNEGPIIKFMEKKNLAAPHIDSDEKTRLLIKNRLQNKYYWTSIKNQLIVNKHINEVDIFINRWVDMMIQFKEDVLALEENQMKELILLSIQLDRIRIKGAKDHSKIDELEEKLEDEYASTTPDTALIDRWEQELALCKGSIESTANQVSKLNADISKLNHALKGTRDQRFSKVDSGNKTFASLIRRIQDEHQREILEREVELMKLSTESKREKLYDFHKYGDGELDQPILNIDAIKYIEGQNEKKL